MPGSQHVRQQVEECVRKFATSAGRDANQLNDATDLAKGLGLSSDEGLDLVLDLCAAFQFDFPHDFNPVVHETGRRGRRLGELILKVEQMLRDKEVTNGAG
jgi:hypothetical protein